MEDKHKTPWIGGPVMAFWPGNIVGCAAMFSAEAIPHSLRFHEDQTKSLCSVSSADELVQSSEKFQGPVAMMLC